MMHAQLRSNGADWPVLGVIEAQDLDFQRARDHRRPPRSWSAAQWAEAGEGRKRALAEMTEERRSLRRCVIRDREVAQLARTRSLFQASGMGMVERHRRGRGRYGHYDSERGARGTLMRHFLFLTPTPGALADGMPARAPVAALVAIPRAAQRLLPANRRARPRAVAVAAVAAAADANLRATTRAVVEPMAVLEHGEH